MELWRPACSDYCAVQAFTYGSSPKVWDCLLKVDTILRMGTLIRVDMPGCWPNSGIAYVPTKIWWPADEEEKAEGHWSYARHAAYTRPTFKWSSADKVTGSVMFWKPGQDDADLEIQRRSLGEAKLQLVTRRRSTSQPPPGTQGHFRRHYQRPCCLHTLIDGTWANARNIRWHLLTDFAKRWKPYGAH